MSDPADLFTLKEPYISVYELDTPKLIQAIRNGIGYEVFGNIARHFPFSLQDWSSILHLTERSLQRYKKENKSFDALQSEKILQVLLLYRKGIQIFGNEERFHTWLDLPNLALGGIKPKSLMDSAFGIDLLKDELTRIEHGIFA
jgi:putative toxin-antitoxin system antitoxin component (TIGR02293 family)